MFSHMTNHTYDLFRFSTLKIPHGLMTPLFFITASGISHHLSLVKSNLVQLLVSLQFIVTGSLGLGAARTNINHRQSGLVFQ